MKSFPLTFAVFFQSIINPNMSLNKNMAKDALFSGAFNIKNSNSEYIAPGTFSDYIKGKRPVRATSVNQICNMQLEELAPRIGMLGLQDMPAVLTAVKNLLEIVDISVQLRQELQTEANELKSEKLYLAKIFQMSLKCSNTKKVLSNKDILFLGGIGGVDFNPNAEVAYSDAEDSVDMNYKEPRVPERIERLLEEYRISDNVVKVFHGIKICWQNVILPDDFEALMASVAPMVGDFGMVNLDFDDIVNVCALDLDNKVCKDGYLQLLEVSWVCNDPSCFTEAFKGMDMQGCQACVMMLSGDYSLLDANEIVSIVYQEVNENVDILLELVYDEEVQEYIKVQALFRMKTPTSQGEHEIHIPKFLHNRRPPD